MEVFRGVKLRIYFFERIILAVRWRRDAGEQDKRQTGKPKWRMCPIWLSPG